ncbi:hypothetical protein HDU76_003154 [Blyttiomyces sp. JEL0837]|nr:hypothetical protein HDU76_003154 [Blyttiomyces sp. JEL0837]
MESLIKDGSAATFGRGQKEILDPTYRQAIKLLASDIATQFHPGSTDILSTLSRFLCEDVEKTSNVEAVVDKLNVYGPGSVEHEILEVKEGYRVTLNLQPLSCDESNHDSQDLVKTRKAPDA